VPDAEREAPSPELLRSLRERAEPDGFVPFDRFMDVALYAPSVGYYARDRTPFGPAGDFYTAPRVHPLFARTIASRLVDVRAAIGPTGPFYLVDLGSGDGRLAAGVLRALGERREAQGVEAVVVDRALPRRASSLELLAATAREFGVTARGSASFAELGPVTGFVLAHELLDAQPARRLCWNGSAWTELGFRLEHGGLVAAERPLRSSGLPRGAPPLRADETGTVLEVVPAAEALVREVADHLAGGLFVVIDFGAEQAELLAGHPRGTLAAVQAHRAVPATAGAAGEADLSVFVNFTRVRSAAAEAGLVELSYRSQAEALGAWGFPDQLERAIASCRSPEEEVRLRLAAKNLLFGFGTFRVLELAAARSATALRRLSEASRPASR